MHVNNEAGGSDCVDGVTQLLTPLPALGLVGRHVVDEPAGDPLAELGVVPGVMIGQVYRLNAIIGMPGVYLPPDC
ncbi:hypothetical protein [Goodfellowiella coeruleoviolacea]|uniref:hypothetical protein n=1 Tax=Goodfellowiella coeruleoviolacea TaxID=334858 RepID=UPI0020A396E9|nr:hypothetical protein [Goodfellowiella coeruleoviolacea]